VGTGTAAAQYGHFTRFPADSSRARKRFPHDGQPSVIGMASTPKEDGLRLHRAEVRPTPV